VARPREPRRLASVKRARAKFFVMSPSVKHSLASAVVILMALGIWLAAMGSYANPWDHNEGVYLNSARLVARGHPLFQEVFSSQPPVFVSSLASALEVLGDRPESGRMLMALLATAGLMAVAFLSWHLFGSHTAPWSVLAVATSYLYCRGGHYAEADLPAAALALVSLAVALAATRRRSLWLAGLAGVVYAVAIMTKVLVVPWLAALALLLLPAAAWRDGRWLQGFWLRGFAFAAGMAAGLAAIFAAFGPTEVWNQAFQFHFDKRGSTGLASPFSYNLLMMLQHFGRDVGLMLLALAGATFLAWHRSFGALWLAALAATSFVFALYHTPLAPNHLIPLGVALGLAAGVGAAALVAGLSRKVPGALAVVMVLFVSQIAVDTGVSGLAVRGENVLTLNSLRNHVKFLHIDPREEDLRIMQYLESHTEPNDFVVSDGHKAVYWAGRASPPFLCDITRERIESGWLTDEDLIRHTAGIEVVVIQTGQLDRFNGFKEWLTANYAVVERVSKRARIYRVTAASPQLFPAN
jgi:hypothetical protein